MHLLQCQPVGLDKLFVAYVVKSTIENMTWKELRFLLEKCPKMPRRDRNSRRNQLFKWRFWLKIQQVSLTNSVSREYLFIFCRLVLVSLLWARFNDRSFSLLSFLQRCVWPWPKPFQSSMSFCQTLSLSRATVNSESIAVQKGRHDPANSFELFRVYTNGEWA